MPSVVILLGGITAVASAIASYLAASPALTRPLATGGVAIAGALFALSAALFFAESSDEAQASDVRVLSERATFPETLSAAAGRFGIAVENRDAFFHTFVIEGHDIKLDLPANRTRRIEVDLPAGTYRYICDVPGHESMVGTLTVR